MSRAASSELGGKVELYVGEGLGEEDRDDEDRGVVG